METQLNWQNCTAAWAAALAEQTLTSPAVLNALARHSDVDVRIAVAENRMTPIETVMALSRDENLDLRFAIAENHNLNVEILNVLMGDSNPFIAERAKRTIRRLNEKKAPRILQATSDLAGSRVSHILRLHSSQVHTGK